MTKEQIIEKLRSHNVFSDIINEEIRNDMLVRLAEGIAAGTEEAPFAMGEEISAEATEGVILG